MPKLNPKLKNFFHDFTQDEAGDLCYRFDMICLRISVKDKLKLSNVCAQLALESFRATGDDRWNERAVKKFITANLGLLRKFVDFINTTVGVKYNKERNRVVVYPEYWYMNRKEDEHQTLFCECGFPFFERWSTISEYHKPSCDVVEADVGSSSENPILVRDEPFDADATDLWDVQFPKGPRQWAILESKLTRMA